MDVNGVHVHGSNCCVERIAFGIYAGSEIERLASVFIRKMECMRVEVLQTQFHVCLSHTLDIVDFSVESKTDVWIIDRGVSLKTISTCQSVECYILIGVIGIIQVFDSTIHCAAGVLGSEGTIHMEVEGSMSELLIIENLFQIKRFASQVSHQVLFVVKGTVNVERSRIGGDCQVGK